jgi:hypothetical protein
MYALTASELLSAWERGQGQSATERALILLSAACPDTPADVLARLSLGQRDRLLLSLREWLFGPTLVSLARCPACDEQLELSFRVADIRAPEAETRPGDAHSLSVSGYEVSFREPNSLDLAAVTHEQDVETGRRLLLERCLLQARAGETEESLSVAELPPEVIESVVEGMAHADPQADVQLALNCPRCGHAWQEAFDILSFFWTEIGVWAARILREVHTLARAYGWREADILEMHPRRRQVYLEMVTG